MSTRGQNQNMIMNMDEFMQKQKIHEHDINACGGMILEMLYKH